MRHSVRYQPEVRGVTERRLGAAERALNRERERLALFADQVASEQPTPEERIHKADLDVLFYDQGHRDLAAKHWKWGRRILREQTEEVQREILDRWETSMIPGTASYFADFVRTQLKRRGIPVE